MNGPVLTVYNAFLLKVLLYYIIFHPSGKKKQLLILAKKTKTSFQSLGPTFFVFPYSNTNAQVTVVHLHCLRLQLAAVVHETLLCRRWRPIAGGDLVHALLCYRAEHEPPADQDSDV